MESWFKLKATCSDAMINYELSQKLKLIGSGKFNHLNHYSNHFKTYLFMERFLCSICCMYTLAYA